MMFQLEIPKRAACCIAGGELLQQGQEYHSALIRGESDENYQRQDYCLSCWEKMMGSQPSPKMISSWKSMVPVKKEGSELPKKRDERALHLLKEALTDQANTHAMGEAFVLALYLARRRLIFLRQEMKQENGLPLNLYEVAETEEMLCVPKFSISHLEVEKIQQELAKKFNAK